MQRITVTVDDEVLEAARAAVAAGHAPSISAWANDAMARRARARAELIAELDAMEAESPTDRATLEWVAGAVGRDVEWVAQQLGVDPDVGRRPTGR